jgi:hypothetical protein
MILVNCLSYKEKLCLVKNVAIYEQNKQNAGKNVAIYEQNKQNAGKNVSGIISFCIRTSFLS